MSIRFNGIKNLRIWAVLIAITWCLNPFVEDAVGSYVFSILMYAGVNIILAVSLNLVNGFTGQFSMGHAGFMAVGGYFAAATTSYARSHAPDVFENAAIQQILFVGSLIGGGFAASLVGYLVGLPSLRLKGDYLAIVTLGFGEIIRVILLNTEAVGGARGLPNIPFLSSFGWVYTWVLIVVFAVSRTINSSKGREMLAVREDEIAAQAMGVDTTSAKVRAFVIGAFFAGVAGGLFGHYLRYLSPAIFDTNRSFEIIIMVVLGGMGSISGSVAAAFCLTLLKEALRLLQDKGYTQLDFRMIIFSLILIALMLTRPNGLFGRKELIDWLPLKVRRIFFRMRGA